MPTRSLPHRPNLAQLKIQADELHRAHREGQPAAAARIAAHHPEMRGLPVAAVLATPLPLAGAQLVLAREYGFESWAQLKHRVELSSRIDAIQPHPRFDEALAALDAGDALRLRSLVAPNPTLVHARASLEPPFGYFTGAMLLHHVAGNPWRDHPLPTNIVEIARLLLDAGADVNALTLGPSPSNSPLTRGSSTMGLVITSRQASEADVAGPLMDLLLEHGARLDLKGEDALDASLANHAPQAAEKMIELGVKPDVLAAAALGRMDLLRAFFDGEGRLLSRPRRHGKEMSDRDAIGLALLYAYVRHQREAAFFLLEKDGNWNTTGVQNGTALHRAAWGGDLDMVQRLIAKGADVNNRDNPFGGTPMAWASHNEKTDVVRWIQGHCAVDLHDAVAFDLRDQIEARLSEDPASVDKRIDGGEIPQRTPLHAAARLNRVAAAKILLDSGADPSLLAGDGRTPLDIADAHGATAVVALLERHGGKRTPAAPTSGDPRLKPFDRLAKDIQDAYQSGDPEALQRLEDFFKRKVTFDEVRRGVQRRLQKGKAADISLAEARDVLAGLRGFSSWVKFAESVAAPAPHQGSKGWAMLPYRIDDKRGRIELRHSLEDKDWDAIVAAMAERRISGVEANGQMTDFALARIADLAHVTSLNLGGCNQLTDAGLQGLTRMPQLEELDLSGWESPITDRGLEVLRHLPALRRFQMCWPQRVSDAGVAHLASCDRLESVDLLGTPTGDGAIEALAGKRRLRRFKTGKQVTDAGLPLLRQFPIFKAWHGGEVEYSLMSADAEPTHLLLDGPFTDKGLATLAGLDGLFGLTFFWHVIALTPAGLEPLARLPKLGFLGCQGPLCDDDAMRHIAAIPRLRMLMGQGTVASDAGFAALSRSETIEYIWGRECPNLTGRGFEALASMPALHGLAVSCKNVDDGVLSALPRFPALKQLMPMDVPDEGFRHVGRCETLEALWCMYCRDTGDAATEHIEGLSKLKTYYAGQTKITDHSLEILARMPALEKLEFWNCAGITDAGVALLAALPRVREVSLDGCRHVTSEVVAAFPAGVRVSHSV